MYFCGSHGVSGWYRVEIYKDDDSGEMKYKVEIYKDDDSGKMKYKVDNLDDQTRMFCFKVRYEV
jgi:ribosomal 30S subunit maturation factor RimM